MSVSRRRRILVVAATVLAMFFLAALIGPAIIPPNELSESEAFICTRCGIRRYTAGTTTLHEPPDVLASREEFAPTELSDWHATHYPDPCVHRWRRIDFSASRYRRLGPWKIQSMAEAGSSATPNLVVLEPEGAALLEAIFVASPELCQLYIEGALVARRRPEAR